jgi:hypothetical protein
VVRGSSLSISWHILFRRLLDPLEKSVHAIHIPK